VVLAEYEYDGKSNRKNLHYPQSGIETSYQYNDGNRIIALENKRQGSVISAWEYSYDVDGNITTKINKAGFAPVKISYCYDRLGRLTEEDYSGWKRTLYIYDAYSNRMKMMVEGRIKAELVSVTSYEYGLNNRLEKEIKKQGKTTETYRYRYDNNGNETFRIWEKTAPTPDYPGNVKLPGSYQMETPTVYEWRHYSGFNQLIRINQDDKEITYQYRGDGLRHSTQVRSLTESQAKTNLYCWDGSNIVAEKADGSKIKTYLWGINLIAREIDYVLYYYLFNEHGDVTQLWSQNGTCKASYEYDAFGSQRNLDMVEANPFRYCGEYFDLSSGTYYLRNRYYNPNNGRFLTEDPAGAGVNWYIYCENNPITFVDPFGLERIVTSGGSDGVEGFKYNFIETAIKQIIEWQTSSSESIAWFIANWNYSSYDLNNFKTVAELYGVSLTLMSDKQQLLDYINKEGRANDPITAMSFFAHGTAFDNKGGVPNKDYINKYAIALGYSGDNDGKHPHNNTLNIFVNDLKNIRSSAFASGNFTFFGSCRTGNSFGGVVFAQEWANITGGTVKASTGLNGRTDYINIYPDNRNIIMKALNKTGLYKSQATREIARAQYGFSAQGSLNYPGLTMFSRWKMFKAKR